MVPFLELVDEFEGTGQLGALAAPDGEDASRQFVGDLFDRFQANRGIVLTLWGAEADTVPDLAESGVGEEITDGLRRLIDVSTGGAGPRSRRSASDDELGNRAVVAMVAGVALFGQSVFLGRRAPSRDDLVDELVRDDPARAQAPRGVSRGTQGGPCTRCRQGRQEIVLASDSGQAPLRHTRVPAESCFLPDLTRFTGSRCAGPDPQRLVRVVPLGGPSLERGFSPPDVGLGYRAPRAPRLARSTGEATRRRVPSSPLEGCESGRIGTLGKRVWGNSPWVRIPLPPPGRCRCHNGSVVPDGG